LPKTKEVPSLLSRSFLLVSSSLII